MIELMETITSAQNHTVKRLVKLANSGAFRRKQGQTLLEGIHLAQEYLGKVGRPLLAVFDSEALARGTGEILAIQAQLARAGAEAVAVEHNVYTKFCPVEHGVGVVFLIEIPEVSQLESRQDTIVLDGVQDAGNAGTILRTAVACGVEQVICSADSVNLFSPKALRAGMGAQFSLRIRRVNDLVRELEKLDAQVVATALNGATDLFSLDLTPATCWVFGSEGGGVSSAVLERADEKVLIPQKGDIESLNVAVAGAVCLYEQLRQRR